VSKSEVAGRVAKSEEPELPETHDRARALAYLLEVGVIPEYAAKRDPVGALIESHRGMRAVLKDLRGRLRDEKKT
jgi:hypothetical protein